MGRPRSDTSITRTIMLANFLLTFYIDLHNLTILRILFAFGVYIINFAHNAQCTVVIPRVCLLE